MGTLTRRPFSNFFSLKGIVLFAFVVVCATELASLGLASTYYVATNGSDSCDGLAPAYGSGSNGPFRTLQRAAYAVRPGDIVQIRGGIYQAYSSWETDGTATGPITITNYGNETVVIDGNAHTIPSHKDSLLLQIYGDWYKVSNLEVRYSGGSGVAVHGYHVTVDNVYSHHNWASGIYITGWYGLINNCRAHNNSLMNQYAVMSGGWSFGISACRYPQHTTIRGCTAWNNWGEGISTFEGSYNTIEDCVSYNNMCNYYVSDSKYCLFQRNLAYCTPGNMVQAYCTQNSISVGDELYNPASSDNTFINNLSIGGERNFAIIGSCLNNALIAHNTFVNASNTIRPSEAACVYFFTGTAVNSRFVNNIVVQDDSESTVMICHLEAIGLTFSNNNWSRLPLPGARGAGDVVGDPMLAKTGSMEAGALNPAWFRILDSSPARDKALVLSQVTEDFSRNPRGSSAEIGAFSITDGSGALTATAGASQTSGRSPLTVTFIGAAGGGTPPYTYAWSFGDGGTSMSQSPSHIYASPGQYLAALTVVDNTRTSATATVNIAVDSIIQSVLTAHIAASSVTGQAPFTVKFMGSASGGSAPYNYRWTFGDESTSTTQNPSHTYTKAGTYAVKLMVVDRTATSATWDLIVNATSLGPTTLGVGSIAFPSSGPAPHLVQFAATPSGGSSPYTYKWAFGDGGTSTSQNPAHTFTEPGTYAVTLTVRDSRSVSKVMTLSVNVLPGSVLLNKLRQKLGLLPQPILR
jgi:PKD repeat protein